MRKSISVLATFAFTLFSSLSYAAYVDIAVLPSGDGVFGTERAGYGSPWYQLDVDPSAIPNAAYHWYSDGSGASRSTTMQFSLAKYTFGVPNFVSATLNLNILGDGYGSWGNGADLNHLGNSATATGDATQKLSGDQYVTRISALAAGWASFDVTSFLSSDITNDFDWSVFSVNSIGYSGIFFSGGEDTAHAPYLRIQYLGSSVTPAAATPEPGTMLLMGFGTAGAAWMRRRKARAAA